MQYLVTGRWTELGALLQPAQVVELLEQAVLPSLEMFVQWEAQGKLRGGVFAGERETAFVLEAGSSEEVGTLLSSLPFWGMMEWHVRPLQSMRSTVERERALLERLKAQTGRSS
jgi:Muconolactone delta-isomerase